MRNHARCGACRRASAEKRNFTLVELLMVVAIIGLLAALLMPGLRKAVAASRTVTCTNNLRQIALGYLSYANDFHD